MFKLDTESKQYKQQGLGDLRIMVDKTTNRVELFFMTLADVSW